MPAVLFWVTLLPVVYQINGINVRSYRHEEVVSCRLVSRVLRRRSFSGLSWLTYGFVSFWHVKPIVSVFIYLFCVCNCKSCVCVCAQVCKSLISAFHSKRGVSVSLQHAVSHTRSGLQLLKTNKKQPQKKPSAVCLFFKLSRSRF